MLYTYTQTDRQTDRNTKAEGEREGEIDIHLGESLSNFRNEMS